MDPSFSPTSLGSNAAIPSPELENRVVTFEGDDGQYEYNITDADWDVANAYAVHADASDTVSFPGFMNEGVEEYRRRLLCAVAFHRYCENALDEDEWDWWTNLYEVDAKDVSEQDHPYLSPLTFRVFDTVVFVSELQEGVMNVIDPVHMMISTKLDPEQNMPVVTVRLDGDAKFGSVYGVIPGPDGFTGFSDAIEDAENKGAVVKEFCRDLDFGDGFPPHIKPLSHLESL